MNTHKDIPTHSIIYTRPTDQLLLLLGGLGTFLYVIVFLVKTEYSIAFTFLLLSIFLVYKYLENSKSKPKLILSKEGIQVIGQPFVSWAFVHGLKIRSDVKGNTYSETLVFTNNGRIQEIPLAQLDVSSWQLEQLFEQYQDSFRESLTEDSELY